MLRTTTIALLIAIASSSAVGQEWANKMFKLRTHDFGTVARNSQGLDERIFKKFGDKLPRA